MLGERSGTINENWETEAKKISDSFKLIKYSEVKEVIENSEAKEVIENSEAAEDTENSEEEDSDIIKLIDK